MSSAGLITQMCCRRGVLLGPQYKRSLINYSSKLLLTTSAAKHAPAQAQTEDFWKKNERLNRPMSPHLTIYKLQMTSLLSLTHRGTGLALSALTSGFAIGMLAVPGSFPHYINVLEATHCGSALLIGAKFVLAFPFFFHFFNGIRHLAWDLGMGFQLKSLYQTGYAVIGLSVFAATVAATM